MKTVYLFFGVLFLGAFFYVAPFIIAGYLFLYWFSPKDNEPVLMNRPNDDFVIKMMNQW